MPQTAFAMRDLLVEEAIYFTARLKGLSHADTLVQRDALMRDFGLADVRRQPISQLSGGMQRTVGFVMALLGKPPLLVLDEPTNDLDPLRRRAVWDAIRRAVGDGAACLLVTHNVLEAEHVVDRVALVNAGRVVAAGSPGTLKARVGEGIRLELFLQDGVSLSAAQLAQLAQLAAAGTMRQPRRQELSLIVPPEAIGATVDRVLGLIGPAALADFRLATVSLEDVYVELVGRTMRDTEDHDDTGDGPLSPSMNGHTAATADATPQSTRTETVIAR
jgi:ABC-type multidrug transport system ATPase subunit